MNREALRVTTTVPVAPTTLYYAWLDSAQHGAMTGGGANVVNDVGAKYSAWDGYITGTFIALDLGRRIVASWRTKDFPSDAPDSRVEVHFEALGGNTRVLVLHTDIPEGQSESYRSLWNDKYFTPMRTYFSKYLPDPRLPPPVRKPPPPPEDDEDDEDDDLPPKKSKFAKAKFASSKVERPAIKVAPEKVVKPAAPTEKVAKTEKVQAKPEKPGKAETIPAKAEKLAKSEKVDRVQAKTAKSAPAKAVTKSAPKAAKKSAPKPLKKVAAKPAKAVKKTAPKPAKPAAKPAKKTAPKPAAKPAKAAKKSAPKPATKPAKKTAKKR